MISLLESSIFPLKIRNAKQVIDSFIRSERIFQDFEMALKYPERYQQNFIVRKWVNIDIDLEFRGFVKNNRLNAVSQYNILPYFGRIVENREILMEKMERFFYDEILPKISVKYSEYIIDFAITGENFDKIWIIELNPFLPNSDACLFSWRQDREILENSPHLEFRVREEKIPNPASLVAIDWRNIMLETTLD